MAKTIRQLREERAESEQQLADALGATLQDIHDLEAGIASPSVQRLRVLTKHFGVDETAINLEPRRPRTLGEQMRDTLEE